jgi:hypothetical protein
MWRILEKRETVRHATRMWDRIAEYRTLVGDLMERDHLEDIDADKRIILK